jgi:hypothetical protein
MSLFRGERTGCFFMGALHFDSAQVREIIRHTSTTTKHQTDEGVDGCGAIPGEKFSYSHWISDILASIAQCIEI